MRRILLLLLLSCLPLLLPAHSFAQGAGGGRSGAGGARMQALMAEQKAKTDAYLAEQAKETETFMKTLAGKGRDEVIAGVRAFKTDHYEKNCAFRAERFAERRAFAESRGAAAGRQAQVARRIAQMDANFEKLKAFHAGKHAENMAFLDGLAADPSVAGEALAERLKEFFQSQKEDARAFLEGMKDGGK